MKITWFICQSIILLLCISSAKSSRFFDILFGNSRNPGYEYGYYRRPKSGRGFGGGYDEYKRICSVINPNPYAFIGSNPYPAVPFCPP